MSRRVANQEQVFRAVVVYKKTEKNPEFIPDKYLGNGQWEHGNKLPPSLYLDEPDEGLKVVYGPYSRIGDARAALKRNGHRRGALRESVHHIRIEFSDLDWKHIAENDEGRVTDLRYRATHRTTYESRPVGRRGERRREIILQRLDAVVEKKIPWRQISIPKLTDAAGCSPATFYQYWTSLESAAAEFIERKRSELKRGERLSPRWSAIEGLLRTEDWI